MTTEEPTRLPPRQSVPSRPRDRRRIAAVVAMIVILGLAAWLLFLRPNQAAGPPEAEPTPTPTTAPSPTAAVDPQMGEDPVAAFRAINDIRTRAFIERRPDLVDQIYLQDCACYELKSTLERNLERGARHVGFGPLVVQVRRAESLGSNFASVQAVTRQVPFKVIDERTEGVLAEDPGWTDRVTYWALSRRGPGTPWLVSLLVEQGDADKVLGPDWRDSAE